MANIDKTDCFPQLLALDKASSLKLYKNSTDLLTIMKMVDNNVEDYIEDFIKFNNDKVSPTPNLNKSITLYDIFNNIDKLPDNIALYWYKLIQKQSDAIKEIITDYDDISESIGSLASSYGMYNDNTIPFYSYAIDDIRPVSYTPNNIFNKIHPNVLANLITTSKMVDAVFKHNLAPLSNSDNANLIQSTVPLINESKSVYITPYSKTTHGDNLVTDNAATAVMNTIKYEIRAQINLTFKKLCNIINALKSRNLLHTEKSRSIEQKLSYTSVTLDNFDTDKQIVEAFDILQQELRDFSNRRTIKSQLG